MKGYIKKLIQEELANNLKEATHPWYTSIHGYYAGETKAGSGPRHTGNVIDYLKPGTLVYNAKGDSKTIKDLTDTHLMFTDGTKDYFMNWFPQKPLNEESATGDIGVGAGPIMTPKAFAKKGQKTNKATQTAVKQGFKKASGMPKNSKMLDYKELWKGKKSAMNEQNIKYQESANKILAELKPIFEEAKIVHSGKNKNLARVLVPVDYANGEKFITLICGQTDTGDKPYFILEKEKSEDEGKYIYFDDIKSLVDMCKTYKMTGKNSFDYPLEEILNKIVKEELLNEVSYSKFKNEVKYRTKAEMLHKGIREVKRKLAEVDQLIEYTTRIKQELSENESGTNYWKRSLKAINEISEISNKISNKIKSIYQ